jgi:hypothetical protein
MKVIFIRHAEKLEWAQGFQPSEEIKANYIDNHLLSPKGYERAHALIGYFQHRQEMLEIYKENPLTTCIAQDVDTETNWGKSERPKDTILPLILSEPKHPSIASKLEFQLYTKAKVDQLVDSLKTVSNESKTVIICWSHQQIPEIVQKLGVECPKKWDKKRFDICWVVDMTTKTLKQFPQLLLYGDLPSVI